MNNIEDLTIQKEDDVDYDEDTMWVWEFTSKYFKKNKAKCLVFAGDSFDDYLKRYFPDYYNKYYSCGNGGELEYKIKEEYYRQLDMLNPVRISRKKI